MTTLSNFKSDPYCLHCTIWYCICYYMNSIHFSTNIWILLHIQLQTMQKQCAYKWDIGICVYTISIIHKIHINMFKNHVSILEHKNCKPFQLSYREFFLFQRHYLLPPLHRKWMKWFSINIIVLSYYVLLVLIESETTKYMSGIYWR